MVEDDGKDSIHDVRMDIEILRARFESHAIYTEKALDKAEESMSTRLDGMNEFREQLKEQAGTFVTMTQYQADYKALVAKIDSIQKIVYIGIGVWLVANIVIQLIPKFM